VLDCPWQVQEREAITGIGAKPPVESRDSDGQVGFAFLELKAFLAFERSDEICYFTAEIYTKSH